MKHEGRGVIRIGDKTDHGGEVVSASSGTIVMGKEAALADDKTHCPKCKGQFAIKPDGKGAKHQGRFYAYHGDVTECGARLLSSLMSSEPAARTLVNTVPLTSGEKRICCPPSLYRNPFRFMQNWSAKSRPVFQGGCDDRENIDIALGKNSSARCHSPDYRGFRRSRKGRAVGIG
jgi:uncharacterized Zn-binding protein involved in type VI secretion